MNESDNRRHTRVSTLLHTLMFLYTSETSTNALRDGGLGGPTEVVAVVKPLSSRLHSAVCMSYGGTGAAQQFVKNK
jgi:hypothetical protein